MKLRDQVPILHWRLAASSRQSLDHVPSIVEQHQGRGVRRLGLGARIDHRDEAIKRNGMS